MFYFHLEIKVFNYVKVIKLKKIILILDLMKKKLITLICLIHNLSLKLYDLSNFFRILSLESHMKF